MAPGAKIGIYAAIGVVSALAVGTLIFYYIRQRRLGAAEAKLADEKAAAERSEIQDLRSRGIDPDGFREHGQEIGPNADMSPPGTAGNPFNHPDDSRPGSRHPTVPGAAFAAGAAGAAAGSYAQSHAAAPRTPTSPPGGYHNANANAGFDFGVPSSPAASHRQVSRTQSDMMPPHAPQSPMRGPARSATADPYRMGSPGPQQGYGLNRMQSPMGQPGQGGYNARQSPGPMQQQYGGGTQQQRTQSPGPGYSGGNQPAYRGQPGRGSGWN